MAKWAGRVDLRSTLGAVSYATIICRLSIGCWVSSLIHLLLTQATVGGSPFGPFISVARGHSRE